MEKLNITVIGTGNAGTTIAADLKDKGHFVTLLKSSTAMHNEHFNYIQENDNTIEIDDFGVIKNVKLDQVTTSFEDALTPEVNLVVLFIQTNYHEQLIRKVSRYLVDNQIVLIEPGYLSTAYFEKYCTANVIVAEAESSPIDCRIVNHGKVKVLFKNVRNPIGIHPPNRQNLAKETLDKLDYNFTYHNSVVEAALNNPNLIVHTIGAIMSIPRIEYTKGDYWMYKEVFTPSVWNLVEELDKEKMLILKKLNLKVTSYVDACKYRNSIDLNLDSKEIFFDYANNSSPMGPTNSDSRYITEDVPEGLVLLESLGEYLSIQTPVSTSLINIASSSLQTDFRKIGRTVKKLGENNIRNILKR